MPKSSPSFNDQIHTLTFMKTAEWPWSSSVLLHTFINLFVGKNIRMHCQYLICESMFLHCKVTFARNIFKSISFLLCWKSEAKKNSLLNRAKADAWQINVKTMQAQREPEKLVHGCLGRQKYYRDQMGSNVSFDLSLKSFHLCRFKQYTTT